MKTRIILSLAALSLCFAFGSKEGKKSKRKIEPLFKGSGFKAIPELDKDLAKFYAFDSELTHFEYAEYLWHLKSENPQAYENALPDSSAWNTIGGSMEPFAELYHKHPAYHNYPIVNLSKAQANQYCKWLGDFLTAHNDDGQKFECRLPTKDEWITLASGGKKDAKYPWNGQNVRDSKGQFLANFSNVGAHQVTWDHTTQEYKIVNTPDAILEDYESYTVTTAKHSYNPNDFGMYQCAGNVAEMVHNEKVAMGGHWRSGGYDIRVTASIPFEKANPFVGFRPILLVTSSNAN